MIRFGLVALCLLVALAHAADPPGADEWKYDVILRKAGEPLRGLILEEQTKSVKIQCIWRTPGKPTLVSTEIIPRAEIRQLLVLEKDDREALRQRLDALKRERAVLSDNLRALDPRGKGALKAADALDFQRTTWPGDGKVEALEYRSSYFRLVANTRPAISIKISLTYAPKLPPMKKVCRSCAIW